MRFMGDMRPLPSAIASATASVAPASHAAAPDVIGSAPPSPSLKILHLFRAPLGGLFRHVVDLVRGQADRGHRVGLILDSTTGGARAEAVLAKLSPWLALGYERFEIPRQISPLDIGALRHVSRRIAAVGPDVLHGHGAKGGALARLAPNVGNAIRVYTPHGGSLIYCPGTISGKFYRTLERALNRRTELFLFESSYTADLFRSEIGRPRGMVRIVRNGVCEAEFAPIVIKADATDIVCVGELRPVKAIDLLIEALAVLARSGRTVTATIAGEGPDEAKLRAQAERAGITDRVRFVGHLPAREAFAMGRIFVIPSRAESLPYVVLEALAAGMPIIATAVGDVPELFGPQAGHLIAPGDITALIGAIGAAVEDPAPSLRISQAVGARVRSHFTVDSTVDGGIAAYREAITLRKLAQFT
jgi:glycosyltransferase involved in cell wall biosynthesis